MTKSTERSSRRSITFTQPSLTKQSLAAECDINQIVKRFKKIHGSEMVDTLYGYAGGTFGALRS